MLCNHFGEKKLFCFSAIKLFVSACVYFSNGEYLILERNTSHLSYTEIMRLSVRALSTAACFLYTPALFPHLSHICLPPTLSLLHSSPLFSTVVFLPSFSHSSLLCPVDGCVHVIITRPPRGNQHWSLDPPDPLMPQHTCP